MINSLHLILESGSGRFAPQLSKFYAEKFCVDAAEKGSQGRRGSRELPRIAIAKTASFEASGLFFSLSSVKTNMDLDETRLILQVKACHHTPYAIYLRQSVFASEN
jgi:hypothetical protein